MVAMVVLLAVSLGYEMVKAPGCVQTSISAFYYTPVRNIFVGALVAIGLCLIVIRGRGSWQDFFLNVAGMLAPVVALVPTGYSPRCPASNLSEPLTTNAGEIDVANVQNNLFALFAAGVVAVAAAWMLSRQGVQRERVRRLSLSFVLTFVLVLVGALLFVTTDWFEEHAHAGAAGSMFVCLGIVVVIRQRASKATAYGTLYLAVWLAMLLGALFCGVLAVTHSFDHTIFLVEAIEISCFVAFWLTRTIETWALPVGRADTTRP